MLGKLLKYELKSTSRIMGVLYLTVLVVAAVVGFIARGMILGATQGNAIAVVISGLIYGLLIVALMIVTIVMVLQRFYKNLLKGEGYLMHTLPVPTWMLVASKVISSLIWILLSIAVLFVSIFVLILTGMLGNGLFSVTDIDWASIDWTNIFQVFRESAGEVIMTVVAAIIQIVRIVLLVYTAMAIGAAAKSHKVFYSVLTFIIILIIMGIIGTVTNISFIDMLSGSAAVNETAGGTVGMFFEAGDGLASASYIGILAKQCITDAIYSVVFFFVTTWFLKNKLNLE